MLDEHLARAGSRRDPGTDVDGDAPHLFADDLAFAGMETGANLQPDGPRIVACLWRVGSSLDQKRARPIKVVGSNPTFTQQRLVKERFLRRRL